MKPDKAVALPLVFLARQPVLQQADWQAMLQKNQAGEMAQNLAITDEQQAALHWGRMLLAGLGVQQDMGAAFAWLQKAAAAQGKNTAAALNMLGRCYEHGWGVGQSPDKAFSCYDRAAEQGDAWAMFNLADCYRKGVGCVPDAVHAAAFYSEAAAKDHVKSLNMLGLCYEEGEGVEQDHDRAAKLFAQGAKKGDCWACLNHARLLAAKGEVGQSLYWLEQSLECQSGDYCQTFVHLFSDRQEEKFQELVAKAQKIADQAALTS